MQSCSRDYLMIGKFTTHKGKKEHVVIDSKLETIYNYL